MEGLERIRGLEGLCCCCDCCRCGVFTCSMSSVLVDMGLGVDDACCLTNGGKRQAVLGLAYL
jgi:hypothetical protein